MENKNVFAENLQYYMSEKNVSRKELSEALDTSYFTVTSWVNGKKYPGALCVMFLSENL